MRKLVIDYIRDILVNQVDIDEKKINIYNQKFNIPTSEGAFIVVEHRGFKIISNRNYFKEETEYQDLNMQESITIGVFSRNQEAFSVINQVSMALTSVYSRQIQVKYAFKIYRNIRIEELSFLEASAMLYRFDVNILVNAWYTQTRSPEFYDTYNAQVRVNDGVPDLVREIEQSVNEVPY